MESISSEKLQIIWHTLSKIELAITRLQERTADIKTVDDFLLSPLSAGDIMHELNYRGFRGREYNANTIGKTMKKLGFESKVIHGTRKYLVTKVDYALHNTENKEDAKEFIPEMF